jgi:hypothetical protein
MTTVHIEHQITDYATWRAAFDRVEQLRADAGVIAHRVLRPVDDERYVVVPLDFDDTAHATAFLDVLRTRIWADPARSPALDGPPRTLVLRPCSTAS